jgi:acid phosphatase class B
LKGDEAQNGEQNPVAGDNMTGRIPLQGVLDISDTLLFSLLALLLESLQFSPSQTFNERGVFWHAIEATPTPA